MNRVDRDRCPECGSRLGERQADPIFDRWVKYCPNCGWEEER